MNPIYTPKLGEVVYTDAHSLPMLIEDTLPNGAYIARAWSGRRQEWGPGQRIAPKRVEPVTHFAAVAVWSQRAATAPQVG